MKRMLLLLVIFGLPSFAMAQELQKGEQIYNTACVACHISGVAGAPKVGDAEAWEAREAKGMDALIKSVTNGLNAMPPKGACGYCDEEDFKAAIQFMIEKSQ